MLDLTKKDLQNVIEIDGVQYSIYTDFRLWMRFEIEVSKLQKGQTIDIAYLFKNDHPAYCNIMDLFSFSRPMSELPRQISHSKSDVITLDYELDSDLIYAAFLGQYGIDLYEEDMHWHKFLALLKGLNDSTRLREVMGYRCYEKSNKKHEDVLEDLRRSWEIIRISPEEQEEIDKFNSYFEERL